MVDISHKNLTGNQLHEPKGADAATADKVYVSDGAGSGTWQKLTASQLQTTGNPFGGQLLHVRETQTDGVASGNPSYSNGVYEIVPLTVTVTNEISGASLSSNQVTLPSGTYHFDFRICSTGGGFTRAKAKLYNVTDASDSFIDQGSNTNSGPITLTAPRITISGSKVFEIRIKPNGLCNVSANSQGETEVYGDLKVWKVL